MNNDNKVETAIAGLDCWANYATESLRYPYTVHWLQWQIYTQELRVSVKKSAWHGKYPWYEVVIMATKNFNISTKEAESLFTVNPISKPNSFISQMKLNWIEFFVREQALIKLALWTFEIHDVCVHKANSFYLLLYNDSLKGNNLIGCKLSVIRV